MSFPPPATEQALHERVIAGDPVASADAYECFMDPLVAALRHDLGCTEDEAYDSAIDALLAYLESSSEYRSELGRLSSYLADIAKKKAIDRLRSRTATIRRQEAYAAGVELRASNPKERMEVAIEAREVWRKVEEQVPSERDRRALKVILSGERSTEELAEALELADLPQTERRRAVKRHRDRLLKTLERLGVKLRQHDDT